MLILVLPDWKKSTRTKIGGKSKIPKTIHVLEGKKIKRRTKLEKLSSKYSHNHHAAREASSISHNSFVLKT